ncbi:MAG: hypothetical protein AB1757_09060 [Acidobacteriota bacterium]
MLRKILRVIAILGFLGSVASGSLAIYVWLTPGDEQKLYDRKSREALEKLQKAEVARGTAAEVKLRQEAKEAMDSANVWGRGARERQATNRLAVFACAGAAIFSFIIFLLTFIKRQPSMANIQPDAWNNHPSNPYTSGQASFDNRQPPQR